MTEDDRIGEESRGESLEEVRRDLDLLDRDLVSLFEKRMDLSEKVARYKIQTGKRVFDKKREQQKLKQVAGLTGSAFNARAVQDLYRDLMAASRRLQYQRLFEERGGESSSFSVRDRLDMENCRVVFQGAEGAYSKRALENYFGKAVSTISVETFRDCMGVLEEGGAEYAVLPIENSTAGIVSEIYDLLSEYEHYIVGEQLIKIEHCLIAKKGTKKEGIRTLYSHAQSLMQCARYLEERPDWSQVSMKNNAFAVKRVREDGDPTSAAIAGEAAADFYGMEVLEREINDEKNNYTRFIIVSNQKIFLREANKISISFEIPHEMGSLYHILSHLIYNGLNMTKIESRPVENRNWEYRFFVDFDGNLQEAAVRNALCALREETLHLRVLGNYR